MAAELGSTQIDADEFFEVLSNIHRHSKFLQNKPPQFVPKEDLVAEEVLKVLAPFTIENGGPLIVKKFMYAPERSNVIVHYPGTSDKIVSFVGSHMDTVPADPEQWTRDPFTIARDGDRIFGRGVTDCLGHVALLTCVFKKIAQLRPTLERGVAAVLIANEENGEIPGIGIDELEKRGELAFLKNGPLVWLDSADIGPTLGTGSVTTWSLTAKGKLFHSGLPHKAINAIELAQGAIRAILKRFYEDFPFTEMDKKYLFNCGTSMKVTQQSCAAGGLNQIPGHATLQGDIRVTPSFDLKHVQATVEKYVQEINVAELESFGYSKFELPEESLKGVLEFKFHPGVSRGVAVNMESPGYAALHKAIEMVRGVAKPFSLTGSLPIIRDLQESGFDVQICGFGRMAAYHANDEFAQLSEFLEGARVIFNVINLLNQ